MRHIIIGTAGHVDHGKSTLIKALTGTDTDRLKEEKIRGISIDLGFATMNLGSEFVAGIVDVPGHERFLKNMLAGTGCVDLAILVVAGDEGVMPQTKEHLAMLDLYGVKHGVIVVTKVDKVDNEWLELVEEEAQVLLEETSLAGAPLCRVSTVTGEGIDALKEQLLSVARQVDVRDEKAPFRLWIDRVFSVKGYGMVVTGCVFSGVCRIGDHLTLYPAKQQVRIRGLECHGQKVEAVVAGQRAALNLVGVENHEFSRGMFISSDGYGQVSDIWDVEAQWQQPIASGTRVRLHLGTGEFFGRIYSFKNRDHHYMRLIMEEPLAGSGGDKGIIRLYSPQALLGGIMLIAPGRRRRIMNQERVNLAQAFHREDIKEIIRETLLDASNLIPSLEMMRQVGYKNLNEVKNNLLHLNNEKEIILIDNYYIGKKILEKLTDHCVQTLADFHAAYPDRVGLSREIMKQKLGIDDKVIDKVLTYWQREGHIVCSSGEFALEKHLVKFNEWHNDLIIACEQVLADTELIAIDAEFFVKKLKVSQEKANRVMKMLIHKGILVQVDTMYMYWKTMENVIKMVQQHFKQSQTITIAQLRDLLNTSRKMALPLLEHLDVNKYTIRTGDIRRPGLKMVDFSEQ